MSQAPLPRLSVRRGLADDDVLFEGVPDHLQGALSEWATAHLGLRQSYSAMELDGRSQILSFIAVRCRIPVDLYQVASTPADDASAELQEAWGKVYGRDPNPSDAWDHAIKAVEILLHPIVSPTNLKATLGSMLAVLESQPEKWALTLATSSKTVGPVEALTGMLRLIWPNPDRHGSGSGASRVPTQDEAEQVVRLAVFVVSWLRNDALQAVAPAAGAAGSP